MLARYYSRSTGQFQRTPGPDTISTPASVVTRMLDAQRDGADITRQPDGTPNDVAALLTVQGMQLAVLREVRDMRSLILNALTGVGYDAMRVGNVALMAEVDAARAFLKNITADPQVLAVTPANGGWEAMSALIMAKWTAYAKASSSAVRGAFAEIT